MDTFENRQVPVDEGDLSEALDAATAWAGYLRQRRRGDSEEAANRIDLATANLRNQLHLRKSVVPEEITPVSRRYEIEATEAELRRLRVAEERV